MSVDRLRCPECNRPLTSWVLDDQWLYWMATAHGGTFERIAFACRRCEAQLFIRKQPAA